MPLPKPATFTPQETKAFQDARRWIRRLYLDGSKIEVDGLDRDMLDDVLKALDPAITKAEDATE